MEQLVITTSELRKKGWTQILSVPSKRRNRSLYYQENGESFKRFGKKKKNKQKRLNTTKNKFNEQVSSIIKISIQIIDKFVHNEPLCHL